MWLRFNGWVVVALCMVLPAQGQSTMQFEQISVDERLAHTRVSAITQDRRGFIWFATENGLFRYDGYSAKLYQPEPNNPKSLPDRFARALCLDREGILWVGTPGGLCRYEEKTDDFVVYRHHESDKFSLSNSFVTALQEDRNGFLWVGTRLGLNRFDKKTGRVKRVVSQKAENTLSDNAIWVLALDRDGMIWVGTQQGGVNMVNPLTLDIVRFEYREGDPNSIATKNIWGLLPDKSGRVWAGTWAGGLNLLQSGTKNWKHYLYQPNHPLSLSRNIILTLFEDRSGRMWCGTRGGLLLFNRETETFTVYQSNPDNPNTIPHNHVWSVFEDRSGGIWVGTDDGVALCSPYKSRFPLFKSYPDNPQSLSHSNVHSFCEDHEGNLWVGTWGGGLNKYDRATGKFQVFAHNPKGATTIGHNSVWAICRDSSNKMWFGTTQGLTVYDPLTKVWEQVRIERNNLHSPYFAAQYARTILCDREGVIWIGTTKDGVERFDSKTGVFTHFRNQPDNPRSLSNNESLTLCEGVGKTNEEYIWVGTMSGELNKLHKKTGEITRYRFIASTNNRLRDSSINSLCQQADGMLWVGTTFGLYKFDPATGKSTALTMIDGLPSNDIQGVIPDNVGNLWISTFNGGLAKYDTTKKLFEVYDATDGLQGLRFNARATYRTKQGELLFGGINGFNLFNPASIKRNAHPPSVVLTSFKILNAEVQLNQNISLVGLISLTHNDYAISFEFAALDFANSKTNQFAYILENFDKSWTYSGTRNFVGYTNLPAGKYIFRAKACNNDGVWNEEGLTVTVLVHPPWYATWWAFTAYIVIMAGVGQQFHRYREKKRQERFTLQQKEWETELVRQKNHELAEANKELRRLNTEKNEFLGIAAHDLKNPLGVIMLHAELIDEHTRADTGDREIVQECAENISIVSQRMLDLVKNLLDINAIEEGKMKLEPVEMDLGGICSSLIDLYQNQAMEKSITLRYEQPEENVWALADYRASIQVIDNVISNAVKYSPTGKMVRITINRGFVEQRKSLETDVPSLNIEYEVMPLHAEDLNGLAEKSRHEWAIIAVHDEGPGFSESDKEKLFGKFARLSARPTGGESSTGLGLSIVKRMVEAMNGLVWCCSERDKGIPGAVFYIALPLVSARRIKELLDETEMNTKRLSSPSVINEVL